MFLSITSVKRESENLDRITGHAFQFVDMQMIKSRISENTYLIGMYIYCLLAYECNLSLIDGVCANIIVNAIGDIEKLYSKGTKKWDFEMTIHH